MKQVRAFRGQSPSLHCSSTGLRRACPDIGACAGLARPAAPFLDLPGLPCPGWPCPARSSAAGRGARSEWGAVHMRPVPALSVLRESTGRWTEPYQPDRRKGTACVLRHGADPEYTIRIRTRYLTHPRPANRKRRTCHSPPPPRPATSLLRQSFLSSSRSCTDRHLRSLLPVAVGRSHPAQALVTSTCVESRRSRSQFRRIHTQAQVTALQPESSQGAVGHSFGETIPRL